MTFVLELTTEVAALRERLDAAERLHDLKTSISRHDVEACPADATVNAESAAWREAYLTRWSECARTSRNSCRLRLAARHPRPRANDRIAKGLAGQQ